MSKTEFDFEARIPPFQLAILEVSGYNGKGDLELAFKLNSEHVEVALVSNCGGGGGLGFGGQNEKPTKRASK